MKKTIIAFLIAVALGGLLATYIFNSRKTKTTEEPPGQTKISAFQIGVYTNKENARKSAIKNNGMVIEEGDIYRVYVTFLKNKESIEKMEDYFKSINLNYYIKDIYVNSEFYNEIIEDEHLIINSGEETYNTINKDIINKYEGAI